MMTLSEDKENVCANVLSLLQERSSVASEGLLVLCEKREDCNAYRHCNEKSSLEHEIEKVKEELAAFKAAEQTQFLGSISW